MGRYSAAGDADGGSARFIPLVVTVNRTVSIHRDDGAIFSVMSGAVWPERLGLNGACDSHLARVPLSVPRVSWGRCLQGDGGRRESRTVASLARLVSVC